MNLYKVDFALEPRKAFEYKNDTSKLLTQWVYNQLCRAMTDGYIVLNEETFNCVSVIIASEKIISKEDISDVCDKFDESITGKIFLEIKEVSLEEIMDYDTLKDDVKLSVKKFVETGIRDKKSDLHIEDEIPEEDIDIDFSETDDVSDKTDSDKNASCRDDSSKNASEDVFERIEELEGVEELKIWARKMKAIYDKNISSEFLINSFVNMTYLVSMNASDGSSTVFRSIGEVISGIAHKKSVEVFEFKKFTFDEKDQNGEYAGTVLKKIGYGKEDSKHRVYVIWADNFSEKETEWISFLKQLKKTVTSSTVIFSVPYLESAAVNDVHGIIEDIIPNTVISIKPMSIQNYQNLFNLYFKQAGMKVTDEVQKFVPQMIAQESSDGRFYGVNTISKICEEIAYIKLSNIASGLSENINEITVDDVKPFLINCDDEESGMEKLDKMVSLYDVKAKIKEIIASLKLQRKLNPDSANSMHMMFLGAPGTGKTVVARLVGKIFRENGMLSLGGFYEVSRKDLVGEYIGSTAPKTANVCSMAYGGVLFIDEAYLLYGGGDKDYGKEAIGTLIAEMENKRNDLVVIFAGYEKDLEKLFDMNPGLRDRIPYRIKFPNYNRDELREIFYKTIPEKFSWDEEMKKYADNYFDDLPDEVLDSSDFSNGRFVRNLVERVVSKASLRMQFDSDCRLILTKSDFEQASQDAEFKMLNSKKVKEQRIGF